jgi:hypothetical protein
VEIRLPSINFDNDYSGGVKINQLNEIDAVGRLAGNFTQKIAETVVRHLSIRGNTDIIGSAKIMGGLEVEGDLNVQGHVHYKPELARGANIAHLPGTPAPPPPDLAKVISDLQRDVAALKKKVGL